MKQLTKMCPFRYILRRTTGALDVLKDSKLTKTQREMCSIISTGSSEILNLVEDALSVGLGGDAQFKVRGGDKGGQLSHRL